MINTLRLHPLQLSSKEITAFLFYFRHYKGTMEHSTAITIIIYLQELVADRKRKKKKYPRHWQINRNRAMIVWLTLVRRVAIANVPG